MYENIEGFLIMSEGPMFPLILTEKDDYLFE
jgi:hypothetical protein